jgi:hypothetical protein
MPFEDSCPFKIGDRVCYRYNSVGRGTVTDPDLIPSSETRSQPRESNARFIWLKLDDFCHVVKSKYFYGMVSGCTLLRAGSVAVESSKFCKCSDSEPILLFVSVTCDKCGKEIDSKFT